MKVLLNNIKIQINQSLYCKEPTSSELGKNILKVSTIMISEMGFEAFTFKKLATHLKTAESSIYRYFTNKHNLLIYLISWYWGYMEYIMVFSCANITDPNEKIRKAVSAICNPIVIPDQVDFIDEKSLNEIIVSESAKSWLTKDVDKENKDGFFFAFKMPCQRLAELIAEANPKYKYPHSLSSSVMEGVISQKYFDLHLATLTDFNSKHEGMEEFYQNLIIKTIS